MEKACASARYRRELVLPTGHPILLFFCRTGKCLSLPELRSSIVFKPSKCSGSFDSPAAPQQLGHLHGGGTVMPCARLCLGSRRCTWRCPTQVTEAAAAAQGSSYLGNWLLQDRDDCSSGFGVMHPCRSYWLTDHAYSWTCFQYYQLHVTFLAACYFCAAIKRFAPLGMH